MKLRLVQLMAERDLSAYGLAKASEGRISRSNAYRLEDGTKTVLSLEELAALCDVLNVEPGALFERAPDRKRKRLSG